MPTNTRPVALLALSLALLLPQAPAQAKALADSDGRVPVVLFCDPASEREAAYLTTRRGDEVRGEILINWCKLERMGAGPEDFRYILAHELGHSRGLDHGEGDPQSNPAYYSGYTLCKC